MPRQESFRRNRAGSIAAEFALLMPVMIALVFGGITATRMVRASMKLWSVAQSLGDLVAQQTTVTPLQLADFCKGAALTLAPFTGTVHATVASVTNASNGTGGSTQVVDWQNATTCGGTTITNALALATAYTPNPQDSVIIVQVTYTYSFPPSYILPASVSFTRTTYSRPRDGTKVLQG